MYIQAIELQLLFAIVYFWI